MYRYWWDGKYWRQSKVTKIVELWTGLYWQAIEPAKVYRVR